jgi:hypothetical protein
MTHEPARILGIVGVQVDAKLLQRFLRQRRTGLRNADQVAVEQRLHFNPVHVEVDEAQVRRAAGRRECAPLLRRVALHPRGDRGEVHHTARVHRKILDLFLEHRR